MSEKKVDESWKEKIEKEQGEKPTESREKHGSQESYEMPPVNFATFITSLGMQALMALGEIENPMTNKKEKELSQAKYLIDIIGLIQEKTKGNLENEEKKIIEQLLYELRMKFVAAGK